MAAPDTTNAKRNAGWLSYGATALDGSTNAAGTITAHTGSTLLGLTAGHTLILPDEFTVHLAEGWGSAWDVTYEGGDCIFGCRMSAWDDAFVNVVWPNTVLHGTNRLIYAYGSTIPPGAPMAGARALTNLVFTPRNESEDDMAVIIYRALPIAQVSEGLSLSLQEWLEMGALFLALPDASNRLATFGAWSSVKVTGQAWSA